MFYFAIIATTVVGLALFGIVSVVVPIVMIPISFFLAYRMAQATAAAEETNGEKK